MVQYQEHHLVGGGKSANGEQAPRRSLFPANGYVATGIEKIPVSDQH
jgi:hypothetical protein